MNVLDIPLNITNINKIAGRQLKVIQYQDLINYDNIHDVLGPNGECVLYLPTSPTFGHWVCIFERENGNIEFFDSYGSQIDSQLTYMKKYFDEKGLLHYPVLSELLLDCDRDVEYNDYKLQGSKSQTCGRWVGNRLKQKKKDVKTYAKQFLNNKTDNDIQIIRETKI